VTRAATTPSPRDSGRDGGGTVRPEPAGVSKLRPRAMAQEPSEDQSVGGATSRHTKVDAGMRRDLPKVPVAAGPVHNDARTRRQSGACGRILVARGYTGAWVWTRWGGFQDG